MPGTSFSVDLLVVTPDQLRKITIKLSKGFKPDDSVEWLMDFGLDERKKTSEQFQPVIKLAVKINPAHHAKADATAKKGFDDAQTSAAFAAADSAKLAAEGEISKQTAQADARRIVAVRGTTT